MTNQITPITCSVKNCRKPMEKSLLATILFLIGIDLIFVAFMGFWAVDASAQMGGWMSPGRNPGMMPGPQGMQGEERRPERMAENEHPFWGFLKGLCLDEKQNQGIKEIRNNLLKETIKQRTNEQIIGIEMKELLDKDPVDLKAVEAALKRKESINIVMNLTLIRAIEEVKSLLTPDQRKKLMTMMKTRPMMREQPHGRFDG